MSVLITSMEMPKDCDECRFNVDGWCYVLRPESEEERKRITTNYCPLTEVPAPHGDLIDRETAKKTVRRTLEVNCKSLMNTTVPMLIDYQLDDAPTIIEAEEGE